VLVSHEVNSTLTSGLQNRGSPHTGKGEPLICDFGIARILEEIKENLVSKTVASGDMVRYSAPELIENNNISATTHSDTYSFAMLILECITEQVPLPNLTRDSAVVHAGIGERQYPPRPDGQNPENRVSDGLWEFMRRCWAVIPDQRPAMEEVHSFFSLRDIKNPLERIRKLCDKISVAKVNLSPHPSPWC